MAENKSLASIFGDTKKDDKNEKKLESIFGPRETIDPSNMLEDSLKDAEKHTAFSVGHIKDLANSAGDWFSNVWHTVTDKDEDKGILDYSEYKRYKDILDAAPVNDTDLTAVYQQMANEGVIDYNKFTNRRETEGSKEQGKYYKFDKAIDAIKTDFDTKLSNAIQPYMNEDRDSYQINAMTKAREVMNNQFSMFLDGYTRTYKDTRDPNLLKDFNDVLQEYETSIVNFTKQRANNLTSKNEGGNKAYYDTLNDAGMLDYAKNIRRIQFETENKLTSAAMKSNFGDSRTALMNGNPISSMAELLGGAMNGVNWVLDKFVGNPVELAKNATIGWYDVVEELANLNVYSNDAGALEKTFGTMASWMGDILDAAPTLVPAVVDIIAGSKIGVIGKGRNASKRATKVDDAIGVIYKNQKAAKNIAKTGDMLINAGNSGNLGTFPLQMLSRFMENVFVFDVAAQQFEGNPITDDMMVFNFLINMPIDTIASLLPEGTKLIAKGLTKTDLITDIIDKDIFDMLAKHYNGYKKVLENGDKATKEFDSLTKATDKIQFDRSAIEAANQARKQGQEKYYMAKSMEARSGTTPKKTVNLTDSGLDEGLVDFIRQVQKDSQGVYDRLSTFGGNLDDYLQEMQMRLSGATKKNLPLETQAKLYVQSLEDKSKLLIARQAHSEVYGIVNYLYSKLNNIDNGRELLDIVLNKVFPEDNLFKDMFREIIFKSDDQGTYAEILKKVNASEVNKMSFDEIAKKTREIMATFMTENKELIEVGESPLGWAKQADGSYINRYTGEVKSENKLIEDLGSEFISEGAAVEGYKHALGLNYGVLGAIAKGNRDAYIVEGGQLKKVSSEGAQEAMGKEIFYDIADDLNKMGNGFKEKFPNGDWEKLKTQNPSAVVYDDVYSSVGLRIMTKPDGTIGIFGTRDAIIELNARLRELSSITDPEKKVTTGILNAYKFLFAKNFEQEVQKGIASINEYNAKKGLKPLTDTEKVAYAKEHKSYLEKVFEAPKETSEGKKLTEKADKGWDKRKGRPKANKETKSKVSGEGQKQTKKAINKASKGEITPEQAEQISAKVLVVEETTNAVTEAIGEETAIKGELTFASTLSKKLQELFNWGTKSVKGNQEAVKKISDTFANLIQELTLNSIYKFNDQINVRNVLENIGDAMGTLMVSPRTISLMEDGGEELMYSLISAIFVRDVNSDATRVLFNRINSVVEDMISKGYNELEVREAGYQIYQIGGILKNVAQNYNRVPMSDSFKNGLKLKLEPYIKAISGKDYSEGVSLVNKNKKIQLKTIKEDRLKEIQIGEVKGDKQIIDLLSGEIYIDVTKLTDDEIDDIAQALAVAQINVSGLHSGRLYNTVYASTKNGLLHLRKEMTGNDIVPVSFNINKTGSNYSTAKECINYGLMSDAQMLGAIDDMMLFENTIMHEYGHAQIHSPLPEVWYRDYINNLKNAFVRTQALASENKTTKLTLSNYFSKYNWEEYLDEIINKYNKDNLIDSIVADFEKGNIDKFTDVKQYLNYLGENSIIKAIRSEASQMSDRNTPILEELINELNTFALLGKLDNEGLMDLGVVGKVNEALDVLSKAAEVIDILRLSVLVDDKMSAKELRKALGTTFDAYSINIARNRADDVAEQLLNGIYKASDNPEDAVKKLSSLASKLNVKTKNANELKDKLVSTLGLIESNKTLQNKYGINKKLASELKQTIEGLDETDFRIMLNDINVVNDVPTNNKAMLEKIINNPSHIREVYFLDVGETNIDIQFDGMVGLSKSMAGNDLLTPAGRVYHKAQGEIKTGTEVKAPESEVKPKGISSQQYLRQLAGKEMDLMLQQEVEQAVPLIRSIATMGEDLGSFGTDALAILTKLVGDINKSIDKNKLIVGDETIKAYNKYIKKGGTGSFGNFVINRVFANVLGEMGMYDDATIQLINNSLRNVQFDAVKASISGPYNQYNNKFFVQIFENLKGNFFLERGVGKPIKDTSMEAMAGVEPLLTKEERKAAKKEYEATKKKYGEAGATETIGRYYRFGRGKVQYTIDGVKKEVDLNTYDGYVEYYNDWEIPMKYTERERVNLSANEVLEGATEGEMIAFNNAMCRYIDALKYGEGEDEALKGVSDAFMRIIEDAGSSIHSNFRFISASGVPTETLGEFKVLDKSKIFPNNTSKNYVKKFLESYNEKPVKVKKPNNAVEVMLGLTKNLLDTKSIKTKLSEQEALERIAHQLTDSKGTLKEYETDLRNLIDTISMGMSQMGEKGVNASEIEEAIEGQWIKFVEKWNNKIANELGADKSFRYDKAEEKSLETLEYFKTLSNDKKYFDIVEDEGTSSLDELAEAEADDIADKELAAANRGVDVDEIDDVDFYVKDGENLDEYGGEVEQSMGYGQSNQALRDSIENFVSINMIDNDMKNYSIIKDSNTYQVTEKNLGKGKNLSVNLGIIYNSLKDTKAIDEHSNKALKIWNSKRTIKKMDKIHRDEAMNIFGKLVSYGNGSFINGDLVKTMNLYGVDKMFGKSIAGKKVGYVQVVMKDGGNILFSPKGEQRAIRILGDNVRDDGKTLVRFSKSQDDLGFVRSVYNSLIGNNGGVEVRFISNEGEQLASQSVSANDVWRSFIGEEINNYLGMGSLYQLKLNDIQSRELYKQLGLKGGTDNTTNYNDIIKILQNIGGNSIGVKNEDMMLFIYQKLKSELNGIYTSNWLADKGIGEVPVSWKEREEQLRKLIGDLQLKMEDAGYKVGVDAEDMVQKVKSLEIEAAPKYYNADGTPYKKGGTKEFGYGKHIKVVKIDPYGVKEVEYIPARVTELNDIGEPTYKYLKSYSVKVDSEGKEIEGTRKVLHNKYRVVGVKPKIDVYDINNSVVNNLGTKVDIDIKPESSLIPDGTKIRSFYYNADKKGQHISSSYNDKGLAAGYYYNGDKVGGYIPIDNLSSIDSDTFWEMVDNKVLESEFGTTLGLQTKVNKSDGEMIIVLANDEGKETEAMLVQHQYVNTQNGKSYIAYNLYFNNDTELGLGLADGKDAYNFYHDYRYGKPKEVKEKEIIEGVLSNEEKEQLTKEIIERVNKELKNKKKETKKSLGFLKKLQSIEIINASKKEKQKAVELVMSKKLNITSVNRLKGTNLVRFEMREGKGGKKSKLKTYIWMSDGKIIDIIPKSKEVKEVLEDSNNYVTEQDITKIWNSKNSNDKYIDDGYFHNPILDKKYGTPQSVSKEYAAKILKESTFINGSDILEYEYMMPLQYSQGAKTAEEMGLLKKTDIEGKWKGGWKGNREVVSLVYENGLPVWQYGRLVDDYKAWRAEADEAEKLSANAAEAMRNRTNPNKLKSTIKETDNDKYSLGDIIEGQIEERDNVPKIYQLMLEDKEVGFETKKLINETYDLKDMVKNVKNISYTDTIGQIYSSSKGIEDVFNFSNFDILGGNNTLTQLRGANAQFRRIYGDRLVKAGENWNGAFGKLSDNEKKELIKGINSKVNKAVSEGTYTIDKVFAEPINEAQEIVNDIAQIFSEAKWNNVYILNKIHNEDSIDNMIYKTFNTYQNVSMGMFNTLKDTNEVREFVFNAARSMGAKDKRAMNLAKDWVGDPLGTGPFMKFLANVRSAYRFAKYSLLSPVSGTLMYLNSAVMSEPLLWAKRSGLGLYYGSRDFKKLVQEEGVTNWLERDSDLILQGANGMQMNGLAVDKAINRLAGIVGAPFGERIKKKIQAAALGGIHSIYDMQRSGAVREYAFAQALKQNGVETESALKDLLEKVHSGEINGKEYSNRRRKIMADTEENYARFFSNANTTALSRHRWSRAFGFNFLQGYVINRADEMMQGIKKMYNFVSERGTKNLTWDDVTYHLAHDNIELKAFLNNILLTTKLGYYLDRVDDYDGSPAKNMMGYFVDVNDYLSSLDTLWFMRLFKTIPSGISDYMEYSDYAKQDATVGGAISTVGYELTAEICSQFFREGKFLNAMMQTIIAGMQTGDLDFAATVAGVEWEKMSNGLGRFGLVDGLEKYGLEDFTEPSDIIGSILFSTNKTTTSGKLQDKMWALANTDKVINDPSYAAVTAIGYLPLVGELVKTATDNGGFNFTEAKYKEMMHMVETDSGLQELYKGKLNTDVYTDEAISRIWSDFTSFNYPAKYEKEPGIHAVGSYIEGKDTTLNSMKEDVFVQNICEKMGITVEELHNMIASDSAKTTGKLKVMAAAEAAEPGSGKIILSYMMANRLYQLEKQYTGMDYPTAADVGDEAMNQLKRIVLEEMGEGMFTADKVSWYKAIREYISIKNPDVFKTLYKNETLNSYVGSIGFMDSLMYDAAQKGDVDAKYIKNARSVLTKYMKDVDARTSAVEYLFSQAANLNIPSSGRHMVMEGILAGNIDFYNALKNSPALSSIYGDVLRSFEERLWGTLDEVDIVDDSYRRQNKGKKYTPYTSNYGDSNGKLEDDLNNKANKYFPKSSGNLKSPGISTPHRYNKGVQPEGTLDWYRKYYEGLIKTYSDKLVKSEGKKYPAQTIEGMTFKTAANNRGSIKGQQLTFPKHKSKNYRTNVLSNLPGSHG